MNAHEREQEITTIPSIRTRWWMSFDVLKWRGNHFERFKQYILVHGDSLFSSLGSSNTFNIQRKNLRQMDHDLKLKFQSTLWAVAFYKRTTRPIKVGWIIYIYFQILIPMRKVLMRIKTEGGNISYSIRHSIKDLCPCYIQIIQNKKAKYNHQFLNNRINLSYTTSTTEKEIMIVTRLCKTFSIRNYALDKFPFNLYRWDSVVALDCPSAWSLTVVMVKREAIEIPKLSFSLSILHGKKYVFFIFYFLRWTWPSLSYSISPWMDKMGVSEPPFETIHYHPISQIRLSWLLSLRRGERI